MATNEELNVTQQANAVPAATAQTDVRNTAEGGMNGYVTQYANQLGGAVDHSNDINAMYQAQLQGNLSQLETANQINNANLEANREDLQKYYQQQQNAAAVNYERNKYNLNTQAAGNGLNVGTGSQMGLALNNQYQQTQGALGAAQMQAEAQLNRQISNLNIQYQGDIAAAIAQNDYQKAAALYNDKLQREQQLSSYYQMAVKEAQQRAAYGDFSVYASLYGNDMANQAQAEWQRERDYENQQREQQQAAYELEMEQARYKQALQDAQNRMQFGDFSGYADIYGDDAARLAQQVWARQNPDSAYDQGAISADEYRNITGKYPAGYGAGSGSGSGNWNDSWYKKSLDLRNSNQGMTTEDALGIGHITTDPTKVAYDRRTGEWVVNGGKA
jgi:hypothetical protein